MVVFILLFSAWLRADLAYQCRDLQPTSERCLQLMIEHSHGRRFRVHVINETPVTQSLGHLIVNADNAEIDGVSVRRYTGGGFSLLMTPDLDQDRQTLAQAQFVLLGTAYQTSFQCSPTKTTDGGYRLRGAGSKE